MENLHGFPSHPACPRTPVLVGPYRVKAFSDGESLDLERFEEFWDEKPGIHRFMFKVVPEPDSRTIALLAGEVDLIAGVPAQNVTRLKEIPGLDVIASPLESPLMVNLYSNQPGEPRRIIERWRRHDNEERRYSGLGYLTPAAFAAKRRGGVLRSPLAPSSYHLVAREQASMISTQTLTLRLDRSQLEGQRSPHAYVAESDPDTKKPLKAECFQGL